MGGQGCRVSYLTRMPLSKRFTKSMSIHNTLFFKNPINYISGRMKRHGTSVIVNKMTDNRYTTFSTEADIDIDMSRGVDATAIDAIFIKYQGTLTELHCHADGGFWERLHAGGRSQRGAELGRWDGEFGGQRL